MFARHVDVLHWSRPTSNQYGSSTLRIDGILGAHYHQLPLPPSQLSINKCRSWAHNMIFFLLACFGVNSFFDICHVAVLHWLEPHMHVCSYALKGQWTTKALDLSLVALLWTLPAPCWISSENSWPLNLGVEIQNYKEVNVEWQTYLGGRTLCFFIGVTNVFSLLDKSNLLKG